MRHFSAQPLASPDLSPDFNNTGNSTEPEEEDACADVWNEDKYNMKMHIAAVFIVLGTSAFGILGAVFIATNKWLAKRQCVLFTIQFVKFFGIGVILATAWIHLLGPAFDAFSNECLTQHGHWERYGTGYVGLFGMIATFFVQGLEFCALARGDAKAKAKAKKAKAAREAAKQDQDSGTNIIIILLRVDAVHQRQIQPCRTSFLISPTPSLVSPKATRTWTHGFARELHVPQITRRPLMLTVPFPCSYY